MNTFEKARILKTTADVFGWTTTLKMAVSYVWKTPKDGFDKKHGVQTDGLITAADGQLRGPNAAGASWYGPTHERVMRHVLSHLDIDYREYEFVDLGCGKGRAVLMATRFPFKKVVGIELSPITSAQARENVARFVPAFGRQLACRDVEILNADALDVHFSDSNRVFYMFRPFFAPVLEQFVRNIEQWARHGRSRILLAYSCPLDEGVLERTPCFRKLRAYSCLSVEHSWTLWEYTRGAALVNGSASPRIGAAAPADR